MSPRLNGFLLAVERWLVVALLLLCLTLAWATDHYRNQVMAMDVQLERLSGEIERQNADAAQILATLTAQRDTAQTALDAAYQLQEVADAAAQQEIDRLRGDLEQRPVRVRIVPQPAACGPGGGGTAGYAPAIADAGAADAAPAYGLLPESNTRRLGAVIAEVETLNAAYASCRAQLMHP